MSDDGYRKQTKLCTGVNRTYQSVKKVTSTVQFYASPVKTIFLKRTDYFPLFMILDLWYFKLSSARFISLGLTYQKSTTQDWRNKGIKKNPFKKNVDIFYRIFKQFYELGFKKCTLFVRMGLQGGRRVAFARKKSGQ